MTKTIALRTELSRLLKTLTTRVYYEEAPDNAVYPYTVYELDELGFDYGKTQYQLEINAFDFGTSTTAVETLSDNIQKALDQYHFINDKIQFMSYRNQRRIIREGDKQILRRRMLFEIHLNETGV